jgi:hypothetical protein
MKSVRHVSRDEPGRNAAGLKIALGLFVHGRVTLAARPGWSWAWR